MQEVLLLYQLALRSLALRKGFDTLKTAEAALAQEAAGHESQAERVYKIAKAVFEAVPTYATLGVGALVWRYGVPRPVPRN
jgi:hypothetical protein